jgi:hypothetical protein
MMLLATDRGERETLKESRCDGQLPNRVGEIALFSEYKSERERKKERERERKRERERLLC